MDAEEARERVSEGWVLSEVAPEDSDYEPRGGSVIFVSDDRETFTLLKNFRGRLHTVTLTAEQIDWTLAVPPKEAVKTNTALVMLIIKSLQGKKPSEYPRHWTKAVYELSLKLD